MEIEMELFIIGYGVGMLVGIVMSIMVLGR